MIKKVYLLYIALHKRGRNKYFTPGRYIVRIAQMEY